LWVIFALLDPDPDPATQINVDPDPCGSGSESTTLLVVTGTVPAVFWILIQKCRNCGKNEKSKTFNVLKSSLEGWRLLLELGFPGPDSALPESGSSYERPTYPSTVPGYLK
jgi:hypothetical protein